MVGMPAFDQGGVDGAQAGDLQRIDQVAGRKHRPALAFGSIGRVQEFQLHFGRRKGHAIQLEVAGFLHLACAHRYVRHDGLADVGLPDPHRGHAIARHACRIDQAIGKRERPHRRRQIAAVAAPVHEGTVDGHLPEQIVHVVRRPRAGGDNHALAGARRRPAHAIDLLAIRIRATDHPQQQRIARRPRLLCGRRQILQAEEHALAGAAAQVGGGDAELGQMGHVGSVRSN